jgi:2-oxo-3-hexenedioate decarboxylase
MIGAILHMEHRLPETEIQAIASEIFGLLRTGRQVPPISSRIPDFSMDDAYRVSLAVRRLREQTGEIVVGRKIGFTNRTIWPEYNVFEPIWGYTYDRTVHDLAADTSFPLAGLSEPRIEPEIMFKFAAAPGPGMSDAELMRCMEWVAHGFELVQSLFPAWKFSAADTVAAFGLHGALLVGPPVMISGNIDAWCEGLSSFEIDLMRDGGFIDRGKAQNVLDGPLKVLRHFLGLLSRQPDHPPVGAGEIVTTGTLTRAMPVAPGETWNTRLAPPLLRGASIRFG